MASHLTPPTFEFSSLKVQKPRKGRALHQPADTHIDMRIIIPDLVILELRECVVARHHHGMNSPCGFFVSPSVPPWLENVR